MTLATSVTAMATVALPGAVWVEKAGSFENATNRLQGFEQAIEPAEYAKSEAQIALHLAAAHAGKPAANYDAASTRAEMAKVAALTPKATDGGATVIRMAPRAGPTTTPMS
jgi:predicted molibdopterin-dependent oxidoreductase YjgC